MADTERVVNGAKDWKPIAPEQDHFSWVIALQFLLQFFVQETCPALSNGKPICLTAEQKTNFEEAYDIFFGSDVEGAVLRKSMSAGCCSKMNEKSCNYWIRPQHWIWLNMAFMCCWKGWPVLIGCCINNRTVLPTYGWHMTMFVRR